MRNTALKVGLLLFALVFLSTTNVSALSSKQLALTEDPFHYDSMKLKETVASKKEQKTEPKVETKPAEEKVEAPVVPPPVTYTVAPGDSLTKIAETHQTEWTRLFAKNTQVANPDTLAIGDVLTIPTADEQIPERPLPIAAPITSTVQTSPRTGAAYSPVRGSSAGNTYAPGYCTWYAKNRRPDLPNRLGNAISWVGSAAAQGFATGTAPQVGAIGQQGNHVVYVEAVNGDGTVTVSEMNYSGLGVVSSRTVSAGSFRYIY